jgi:hypothetical protein
MTIGVFVSYRRTDSGELARRLKHHMSDKWGKENIFFDVDVVTNLGTDIRTVIRETIAAVDAVAIVIGPKFETKRLHQENDYVRLELTEAVAQRRLVVPVLVDGAAMPKPNEFPSELADIAFINAPTLRPDPDFDQDLKLVMTSIVNPLARNKIAADGGRFIRFPDGTSWAV